MTIVSYFFGLEGWLTEVVPKPLQTVMFNFSVAKKAKITDPFLGVLEKVMMILVLLYVVNNINDLEQHKIVEVPVGYPTYEFLRYTQQQLKDGSGFNSVRNDINQLPYCSASEEYEYLRAQKDDSGNFISPTEDFTVVTDPEVKRKGVVEVFNDDKIGCKQINYAELKTKQSATAYLTTFQKETLTTSYICDGFQHPVTGATTVGFNRVNYESWQNGRTYDCQDFRESSDDKSTIIGKADLSKHFRTTEHEFGEDSCACLEMRNYFSVAPESIGLEIFHSFRGSEIMHSVAATSMVDSKYSPTTFVVRDPRMDVREGLIDIPAGLAERLKVPFEPGQPISFSLKELLQIAGADLDDAVDPNTVPLRPGQPIPKRRVTGVRLNIDLVYSIEVGGSEPTCEMRVSFDDGLQSWSQDARTHQRHSISETWDTARNNGVLKQYSEVVNRGIVVQFQAKGIIKKFDFFQLMNVLTQGLVLFPLATFVVYFLAITVSPRRKLYSPAINSHFNYEKELGSFGISSLFVVSQYAAWKKDGKIKITDTKKGMNLDELTEILMGDKDAPGYPLQPKDVATNFAATIFDAVKALRKDTHTKGDGKDYEIGLADLLSIETGEIFDYDTAVKMAGGAGSQFKKSHKMTRQNTTRSRMTGRLSIGGGARTQPVQPVSQPVTQQVQPQVQQQQQQMQVQQMQQQQQQQQPRNMAVVIPAGVGPGSMITVQTPLGTNLQVAIPPNAHPGMTLQVPY